MKILQVCEYYQYLGGTEQYIIDVSKQLESLGHKVAIVYGIETEHTLKSSYEKYFFPSITKSEKLDKDTEKNLLSIIKEQKPDIIYAHNVENFYIIERLSTMKPLLRFVHDHRIFCPKGDKILNSQDRICEYPCGLHCFINAYLNRCLPRNPYSSITRIRKKIKELKINRKIKIIVASHYMKNCLLQNGFLSNNVEVLPYYCDDHDNCKDVIFDDFILFVGRICKQKGLQFLIQSMKKLPQKLKLVVIGDGHYLPEIKLLVKNFGLENRINILGSLLNEEIGQYYKKCLAVIMPSIWTEPFGIVGIEAMSYGKPVIAFNVGGISEWLKDGENGFLVERGNISQLVEKIQVILNDKELCKKMGKNARNTFESKYTKMAHIKKLLEIFDKTINSKL